MITYLEKMLVYPTKAKADGIQGRCVLNFVVDSTGKVVEPITVMRGVSPEIDAEALRVVRTMPLWKPALQRGKPVNMYYTLLIMFSLKQ